MEFSRQEYWRRLTFPPPGALAKAVAAAAEGLPLSAVERFEALPGHGLRAMLDGKALPADFTHIDTGENRR